MPQKQKAGPTEVFVSHSSGDSAFVGRLDAILADHGVQSFVSKTSIRGAQQWHDKIGAALIGSDVDRT